MAAALLHLFERARPVRSQEARQRTIREQLAARLALGAIVGLVVRVPDTLDGGAAVGAGLAVAAVDGHPRPEGRHALGELAARSLPQAHDPVVERSARRLVEPRVLTVAERPRLPHGREPRAMQDLVRVRVADAREDVRVGQRALERVVLAGDRAAELLRVTGEGIDPARVERLKPRLTPHEMYRGALLRARLGQRQRAR